MRGRLIRAIISIVLTISVLASLSGCVDDGIIECVHTYHPPEFTSFEEIPDITEDEIREVKELLSRRDSFTYAMLESTETFIDENGDIGGYTALVCEWLTELFGVEFIPEITAWESLLGGMASGEIDFTGTLTPTDERREEYFMTAPVAQRWIRYYKLSGAEPSEEIPRYAFLQGSVSAMSVVENAAKEFEPVWVADYAEARRLLLDGEVDALVAENTAEAVFDGINNIASTDYFPMEYAPVSISARNPELEIIIQVIQKALEAGADRFLNNLYKEGYHDYLRHKLHLLFTEDELEYIKNNPVIPLAAEYGNYPLSFYNSRYNEWQGIAFDVLEEVEALTGLRFELIHGTDLEWTAVINKLEQGEAYLVTQLFHTKERDGRFLWPDEALFTEQATLISRAEHIDITINEIYSAAIGVAASSAYAEVFSVWFPDHKNIIEYENINKAFTALEKGEVEMVIAGYSSLSYFTNYLESPGYKANVVFGDRFGSTFGINKEHEELKTIIEKTLRLMDTESIAERWIHKSYDYRLQLAQAQVPWFIGTAVLTLLIVTFLIVLFMKVKQNQKIQIANRAKSAFLANMSHEIRTPMNAVLGVTEIMIQNEVLSVELEEGLDRIYSSCEMLMGIINDILDFSKIEAGKLDLHPAKYRIASLINDSVNLNMMRLEGKPIDFELNINETVPAELIGDELRIKQILNNLLSNAFKYTDKGNVTLTITHEPIFKNYDSSREEDIVIVISVQDTGIGLTDEQLAKLFDEYTRFHDSEKKTIEGTGLGLPITLRLIEMMNGEMDVKSKRGEGSLFTIKLPQKKASEEPLGIDVVENLRKFRTNFLTVKQRREVSREPMPYGNVLIVDDVETNLYVAIGLMKIYKLKIDTAISGFEAIDKIKNGKVYDIIFMDHMMPDMDGIEATKLIRGLGYNEPIVALTANAVAGQASMFLQNGFDDFIAKPIDIRQLKSILIKRIRDKQPPEVIEAARLQMAEEQRRLSEKKTDNTAQKEFALAEAEIEGLDIRKGIKRYNNDENTYIKVLRSYATGVRKLFDLLESVSEENLNDYRIKVHGIKGTSADLFADKISKEAFALEKASENKDMDFIKLHNPPFIENLKKIIGEIDEVLTRLNDKNPKPDKEYPDSELLLKLLNACKEYKMDDADEAMAELDKYRYTADNGLISWLKESLDRLDFSEIEEKLSKEL